MIEIENFINKSFSINLILKWKKNGFQEDKVNVLPQKLTLNTSNVQFLLSRHFFGLQNVKISFECVDF